MDKRRLAILTASVVLAFSVLACGQTGAGDPPLYGATAQAAVYQATAVAEATRQAQDAQARATADTLAVQAQATRQVMDAQATVWALSATQTAAAQEVQATATARAATSTAIAQEAEATREAAQATATRQAVIAQEKATQATATAQAIKRQDQREETTQALVTAAPWVGLVLVVLALAYLLPGVKGRITTHRRRIDEGEPIIVDGDAIRLPLRGWDVHGNTAPTPELQERVTARTQLPAVVAAGRGQRLALSQARKPARLRGPAPGLVKVVAVGDLSEATAAGILPPRLAEAIEGQWTEIEEIEQ